MKITPIVEILTITITCISTVACRRNDPSILIIGAGPAGIAAAARLLEKGFRNLTILEAESRIGGRIRSVKFGDAFVDLGAQWCHGEEDNAVYDLVKDLDVLKPSGTSKKFYHSSGERIDDELSHQLFDIMDSVYSANGNRLVSDDLTVGDYCVRNYNRTLYQKYAHDKRKRELALITIEYFHHRVLSYEGSFSWFEPAARNDYRDCAGNLMLNWNGLGYKTVLEVLMKKFPNNSRALPIDDKLFLNKEVTKIRWKRKSVTVVCADGSIYLADHVIFTPSVGVLKEKAFTLFEPSLPDVKNQAIGNIGFGAVMKVALLFSKRWWREETGFSFIWSENDKWSVLRDLPDDPSWLGRSWVTYLYAVETAENNPNVLFGWFTGNFIPLIEQLPEKDLVDGIDYVLKKFLSRSYQIIKPNKIIRSQWYSNPRFRGVYSFQTVRCRRGKGDTSANILAAPLTNVEENRPVVQFAGEATHPYYFSTVHGAIETGYREADALINLYSKHA
ncbi:hypothetical protein NQ315_007074 [Exocentrus adspersus]|uniref:Amine oxidase domain-containing protein n=1 Tax=Exocentrus adspersus TaxID=1586481 RepID=A0AAV8WD70_9CUCU|nr:hypothetical protein NQ315_007074 [Exocentrus adspersus]